jgi:predicted AAA+ superfamily ATPase
MFFELRKYSASFNKQIQNAKKIYLIDNAFHNMMSFISQANNGRKLENIVHLFFRSQNYEMYYFNENVECDFVAFQNNGNKYLTQVCWELTSANKDREIKGLSAAMKLFETKTGTIITFDQEEEITADYGVIRVVPVWKFLLRECEPVE